MAIQFSIDASGLQSAIRRLDKMQAAVDASVGTTGARRVSVFGRDAIQRKTRKHLDKNPTGALERSWQVKSRRSGALRTWTFFSEKPYAAIHNTGGIIRPRSAQVLTIPVTSLARQIPMGPRAFPGELRSVPWGLIDRQGTTQYVFSDRVRIRATGYIDEAMQDTIDFALFDVRRRLRESLRGSVRAL